MKLSFLLQEAFYFIKFTFAVRGKCHSSLWPETTTSLMLKRLVISKAGSHSWWLPFKSHIRGTSAHHLIQDYQKTIWQPVANNILNICEIIQDRCRLYNISAHHYLRHSVLEWGKRHGIININTVIIKFHNKSWAAFGCKIATLMEMRPLEI